MMLTVYPPLVRDIRDGQTWLTQLCEINHLRLSLLAKKEITKRLENLAGIFNRNSSMHHWFLLWSLDMLLLALSNLWGESSMLQHVWPNLFEVKKFFNHMYIKREKNFEVMINRLYTEMHICMPTYSGCSKPQLVSSTCKSLGQRWQLVFWVGSCLW